MSYQKYTQTIISKFKTQNPRVAQRGLKLLVDVKVLKLSFELLD